MSERPAPFRPREIFRALHRHNVRYVAIGGFAVVAHGVLRTTADVDIVPEPAAGRDRDLLDIGDLLAAENAGRQDR